MTETSRHAGRFSAREEEESGVTSVVVVRLPITLGQFLKIAGLVTTGGQGKQVVAAGLVRVNGEVEVRRGRKLIRGDVVEYEGRRVVVGLREDVQG